MTIWGALWINSALQLSHLGGGVGISLSNLRELVHLSRLKERFWCRSCYGSFSKIASHPLNQLGQRWCGVVYLSVFHPDVSFLSTKKKTPMKSSCKDPFTWCCLVPDKFYRWHEMKINPFSVRALPFNYIDICWKYDELVNNPTSMSKIKAWFGNWNLKLQQESGYTYGQHWLTIQILLMEDYHE